MAKLQEDQRQFDITAQQAAKKQQSDESLKLTELEMAAGKDLNAQVQDNMMVFDPAIGDFT